MNIVEYASSFVVSPVRELSSISFHGETILLTYFADSLFKADTLKKAARGTSFLMHTGDMIVRGEVRESAVFENQVINANLRSHQLSNDFILTLKTTSVEKTKKPRLPAFASKMTVLTSFATASDIGYSTQSCGTLNSKFIKWEVSYDNSHGHTYQQVLY